MRGAGGSVVPFLELQGTTAEYTVIKIGVQNLITYNGTGVCLEGMVMSHTHHLKGKDCLGP